MKNIQTRALFAGNLVRLPCFDSIRGTSEYRIIGDLKDAEIISSYDTILLSGKTTDNMSRLIYALRCIKENYIILSHEDFFLYSRADAKRIEILFNTMKETNAVFLSLVPNLSIYEDCSDERQTQTDTKQIPEDTPYRFNFQVGIWRKDFLLTLLQNYTNIWDFERRAYNNPITKNTKVLSTFYTGYPYIECVRRGKRSPEAIAMLANENISVDLSKRRVLTNWEVFKFALKGFLFNSNRKLVTKLVDMFQIGYRVK